MPVDATLALRTAETDKAQTLGATQAQSIILPRLERQPVGREEEFEFQNPLRKLWTIARARCPAEVETTVRSRTSRWALSDLR
jgi:hypothetical protein